jgi:hypothetical protein
LRPEIGFVAVQNRLHVGLLFAVRTTDFASDEGESGQPGGMIKPTGEDDVFSEMSGFSRQNDEHRLSNFFGLTRISRVPKRDGIDFVDMSRDERGKGWLGAIRHVFAQQSVVIQFLHL